MHARGKLGRLITEQKQAIRARLRMMSLFRASLNGVENGVASKGGDPEAVVVQAQQDLLREEEIRAYERLASQAKALDEAWENLKRGTYGICRQCRGQIPQRRLEALPGAALCHSCQEEEEQAVGGVPTRGGRASLRA